MSFLMLWKKLKEFLYKWWFILLNWLFGRPKKRPKISLLIPFATKNQERRTVFKWLIEYWKHELPEAEIIIGHSNGKPFSKTQALNDAARRASGRVLVILDADTYIPGKIITRCANRILEEAHGHERLWFVPYRHLWRLNKAITKKIIESDPRNPLRLPSPPLPEDIDDDGQKSTYGHRYGAMIMIFPREALNVLGCFDERFKGWGGEDIAILRALDTLWAKHKTTNNDVLHLWHPFIGHNYKSRVWKGQDIQFNNKLSNAYNKATRNPSQMRKLVDVGCKKHKHPHHKHLTD